MTVFTNGCFDLLHVGHVRHLLWCSALGSRLVVAVNSDEDVERLKGRRPIFPHSERMELVRAVRCVSEVRGFSGEEELERLIALIRPDVLAKGPPWNAHEITGAQLVRSWGGKVVTHWNQWQSTSAILERFSITSRGSFGR